MKSFNDLEIGDKLYFIDCNSETASISEIKSIDKFDTAIIFKLFPIIGHKSKLFIVESRFESYAVIAFDKVFVYEEDFLEELNKNAK